MGMLFRTFSTREKKPMMIMFNTYIKSKMEYCCIVWSPVSQKWIYELGKIQKSFTSKINGMEELDYHERLKKIKPLSHERREVYDSVWMAAIGREKRKYAGIIVFNLRINNHQSCFWDPVGLTVPLIFSVFHGSPIPPYHLFYL